MIPVDSSIYNQLHYIQYIVKLRRKERNNPHLLKDTILCAIANSANFSLVVYVSVSWSHVKHIQTEYSASGEILKN